MGIPEGKSFPVLHTIDARAHQRTANIPSEKKKRRGIRATSEMQRDITAGRWSAKGKGRGFSTIW